MVLYYWLFLLALLHELGYNIKEFVSNCTARRGQQREYIKAVYSLYIDAEDREKKRARKYRK